MNESTLTYCIPLVLSRYLVGSTGMAARISELDHQQRPAGRVGRPERYRPLAASSISSQPGFITGVNFVVERDVREHDMHEVRLPCL